MSGRFVTGDRVTVLRLDPPGHMRAPTYIRGHTGVVERVCGVFRNPESLAYGGDGLPKQPLYRVRFTQTAVWPGYDGTAADTVDVEIYEHWLDEATEGS
jgi:nitrile hydratase